MPAHSQPRDRHPRRLRQPLLKTAAACALVAVLASATSLGVVLAGEGKPPAAPEPNAVYLQPLEGLSTDELATFRAGEAMFRTSWVVFPALQIPNWDVVRPPSMIAWGLGPTYIANACMACHVPELQTSAQAPFPALAGRRFHPHTDLLLHDGRARSVTEAILWHGGEAQDARDRFARLSREEREALLAFVNAI